MPLKLWLRRDWGAKYWKQIRKKWLEPLYHPLPYVLLYYHSFIMTCMEDIDCKKMMKKIQKYHIQFEGFADIAYNFVISGDGTVYEGRGFITKSEVLDEKYRQYHGKSLDIAFLGDFREGTTDEMNEAVTDFIQFAIEFGYLREDPEIIEITDKIIDFSKLGTKKPNTFHEDIKRTNQIMNARAQKLAPKRITPKQTVKKKINKPLQARRVVPMYKPLNLKSLI